MEKFQLLLSSRFVRYFLVGGTTAVFDLTLFFIFAKLLGFNYLIVSAVVFIMSVLINYLLSIKFVFRSGARFSCRKREMALIYIVSAIGLLLHQLVLYGVYEYIYPGLMVAKLVATGTVFGWNFSVRLFYIFRENGA